MLSGTKGSIREEGTTAPADSKAPVHYLQTQHTGSESFLSSIVPPQPPHQQAVQMGRKQQDHMTSHNHNSYFYTAQAALQQSLPMKKHAGFTGRHSQSTRSC